MIKTLFKMHGICDHGIDHLLATTTKKLMIKDSKKALKRKIFIYKRNYKVMLQNENLKEEKLKFLFDFEMT
jgi:hypothetical protein